MAQQEGEKTFHYTPVVQEVTLALQDILHAHEWHEGLAQAEVTDSVQRLRMERGNLQQAFGRITGAMKFLAVRNEQCASVILEAEQAAQRQYQLPIEKLRRRGDRDGKRVLGKGRGK